MPKYLKLMTISHSILILYILKYVTISCHQWQLLAVFISCYTNIMKDKAVPLKAWSGPEGSRKLRFPDLMTAAQDGGKVVSLRHWPPLPPGNTPGTHFC